MQQQQMDLLETLAEAVQKGYPPAAVVLPETAKKNRRF